MATNEDLIKRLQTEGKGAARASAVLSELWGQNIKLIKKTVSDVTGLYQGNGGFDDMLQQAYFGLYNAAYAFDTESGLKFSTLLVKYISWELYRYSKSHNSDIQLPEYMRRRIKKCLETKQNLEVENGSGITYEKALQALNLSDAAVKNTLTALGSLKTVSIFEGAGGESEDFYILDLLAAEDNAEESAVKNEWQQELHTCLLNALKTIPEETQSIIKRHYLKGISVKQIAEECGCTTVEVYRKEKWAFRKIRIGKYGGLLSEFMPSANAEARAKRKIKKDNEAIAKLHLTDNTRGLIVL
ncbi:MAG: sigma-70 family RNA polymerase sigma factor [Clostridiales bacterium]|nr:sigma-70 family RNA polymerase sigma factor [Clostridiales bacterium]